MHPRPWCTRCWGFGSQVRVLILAQTPRVSSVLISVLPPVLPVSCNNPPLLLPTLCGIAPETPSGTNLALCPSIFFFFLFPFFSLLLISHPFYPPLKPPLRPKLIQQKKISHLPHPNIHRLPSSPYTLLFFTTPSSSTGPAFGASRYYSERHHRLHFIFRIFVRLPVSPWRLSSAARR